MLLLGLAVEVLVPAAPLILNNPLRPLGGIYALARQHSRGNLNRRLATLPLVHVVGLQLVERHPLPQTIQGEELVRIRSRELRPTHGTRVLVPPTASHPTVVSAELAPRFPKNAALYQSSSRMDGGCSGISTAKATCRSVEDQFLLEETRVGLPNTS